MKPTQYLPPLPSQTSRICATITHPCNSDCDNPYCITNSLQIILHPDHLPPEQDLDDLDIEVCLN